MATIYIDNKPYEVKDGQNLLHACLSLGFDIPYFCWHPALGSVGACRQCAVKQFRDAEDTQGRIVMSCMTPASEGTRISIDDPEIRAFRASVIEWLMTNHPHDCPVCDEGGECHLQDMSVMTGHNCRRYRFQKRTYVNQNLGPFIAHEMNRCIQCYRCVRYYRDFAGGHDLEAFSAHNHVCFGRHQDGALENEFSGNLVEVCPTGVFTDKTFRRHYTRPWDQQRAPAVCVHCGVGCNTTTAERYGEVRRIRNRYNGEVNGYFLCDRGRFGYEFVNGDRRIRRPLLRRSAEGTAEPISARDALVHLRQLLDGAATRVIGIGSPRASLESNYALRALVGPERFYVGASATESRLAAAMIAILREGPVRTPSLREMGEADAVLVLGEDLTNVAPRIALQLRQSVRRVHFTIAERLGIPGWNDLPVREAAQEERSPLFVAHIAGTKLDDIAARCYRAAPDDLARLGFAVAHAIDPQAPAVAGLPDDVRAAAEEIARALQSAQKPLVVSGPSCGSRALLEAAANVAWSLHAAGRPASLCFAAPECNSMGLALMGGADLDEAFKAAQAGDVDTVIVLENDLYRRAPRASVDAFLASVKHVVALDHISNETTPRAEVVLPAATFVEGDGTLVSHEGRAQRSLRCVIAEDDVREGWQWLRELRAEYEWRNLDGVVAALAQALPAFRDVANVAPAADARFVGQKIPRQPHRYSGRTSMRAHINVSEPKAPEDTDSALAFSMEGYLKQPPASVTPGFWAPGWNSPQSVNKFQEEVGGPLRGGDPGVRLLEPAQAAERRYFQEVPAAFSPRATERLVAPLHHIFGSEELSVLAPGIAERTPKPYVALNEADAAALHVGSGGTVEVRVGGVTCRLPVEVNAALPAGVAGLPANLPGMETQALPNWGAIERGDEP